MPTIIKPVRAKVTGTGPFTITANGQTGFGQFTEDGRQYLILVDDDATFTENPPRWAMFYGTFHLGSGTISVDLIISSSSTIAPVTATMPAWVNDAKNLRSRPLNVG